MSTPRGRAQWSVVVVVGYGSVEVVYGSVVSDYSAAAWCGVVCLCTFVFVWHVARLLLIRIGLCIVLA